MPLVVGVSFKKIGKVYFFDPAGHELREGDCVIAETARGIEFGEVMTEPKDVSDDEIVSPLKKIVRVATREDVDREEANRQREKQAFSTCQQKIQKHNLPMKLIDADFCFDGSQVTFYFSAEARVDFRELVKDLAGSLRTKVQLHQVGVRDEAKLFGGMGTCGRSLCCATFLNDFEPVSMRMAKEQSLFLNPIKFSGICGKLMCCLKYEYPTYKEVKSRLPGVGSMVETSRGPGKVAEVNIIKESLAVDLGEGVIVHLSAEDIKGACQGCQGGGCEAKAQTARARSDARTDHEDSTEPQHHETPAVSVPDIQPHATMREPARAQDGGESQSERQPGRRSGRRRNRQRK